MESERIAFMEHLAFRSDLGLVEACAQLAEALGLPPLELDSENETEWGLIEVEGVEFNLSRPYDEGKLQEWNNTTPSGCNFGVILIVAKDHLDYPNHERAVQHLVPSYGQRIADALRTVVYHHGQWLGPGRTLRQATVFRPTTAAR